jgi:chorismate mutase/prephenate dehydratase
VLPIENSSYGSVTEVYDLMKRYNFYIARSTRLYIRHYLLAPHTTKLQDIEEIFSHEQAIGQCSEFLKTLKDVKITECENTAVAAKRVAESENKNVAAISSKNCAELYDLAILTDDVQNTANNYTRFIVISKDLKIYPGANKISLMLSVDHRPGSLNEVLSKFASVGFNLTKLESRPVPNSDFEFKFYFDFDASIYSDDVTTLISDVETSLPEFSFLGSYLEY